MLKKKEQVAASHIQANYDKLMNMKHKLDTLIEKHALVDGEDELLASLKAHRSKIDQSIVNLKKESGDSLHFIQKHMATREDLAKETAHEAVKDTSESKPEKPSKPVEQMTPAEKARKEAQDLKKQIRAFEQPTDMTEDQLEKAFEHQKEEEQTVRDS